MGATGPLPERRDVQADIADMRVNVATLVERSTTQGQLMAEIKAKLESTVSRGEYETRHGELDERATRALKVANDARDETLRRQGAERAWKIIFTAGMGLIGLLEVYFHGR